VISIDRPEALTFARAALRRGYEEGGEVEVMDVPACDGNGDERCGDDDELVVPRV